MRVISHESTEGNILKVISHQIPHFSYRNGFSPLPICMKTCDSGWGCCFRSFQGVLAQFFMKLFDEFPKKYREKYLNLHPLNLFADNEISPFSIHNLVNEAHKNCNLDPGNWAKPSQMIQTILPIFQNQGFSVLYSHSNQFSKNSFENLEYPCMVLIPTLLGLDELDQTFIPFLQLSLCVEGSLGFVSGHNVSAYFIVGFDENNFLYFDPHTTLDAVNDLEIDSYYHTKAKRIAYSDLNPSILLAFFAKNKNSLKELLFTLSKCSRSPVAFEELSGDNSEHECLDIDDLEFTPPSDDDNNDN